MEEYLRISLKTVIVMDSAKYHIRHIEKTPTMYMKKGTMIAFMSKHESDLNITGDVGTSS